MRQGCNSPPTHQVSYRSLLSDKQPAKDLFYPPKGNRVEGGEEGLVEGEGKVGKTSTYCFFLSVKGVFHVVYP